MAHFAQLGPAMDDSEMQIDGFASLPPGLAPTIDAPPTRIVGIGASAGGLESLEHLFAEMPCNTGMAFVVVQHLSPDFRSLMDELIARHSDMPVRLADHGTLVQANHIYLMPPRKEMIIRERRLILTDKEPGQGLSLPIDQFFRSLAQDQGPQAVAVVLSGSGSDGSRGIVDVKRAGGMVLAESVASAKFDGMPLSAQATGVVDDARMPRDLARILCGLPPLESVEDSEPLSEDPAMDETLRMLRDQFGIDFSLYKTSTVARRVQRRVDLLRVESIAAYVDQLHADPDELDTLYQDLLIGVTQFFRDPEAFETLEREVIPQLLERVPPAQELRMWIAGCATGEEAYSLAIVLREEDLLDRTLIYATDINPQALRAAEAGIYEVDRFAKFSEAYREAGGTRSLADYYTASYDGALLDRRLRASIVFSDHSLATDSAFAECQLVSCRNVLIYFERELQERALAVLSDSLCHRGFLGLGAKESLRFTHRAAEYAECAPEARIYRKR
jgi:two-component system CheB/CheR fusion protein